jgi:hypothetical protein
MKSSRHFNTSPFASSSNGFQSGQGFYKLVRDVSATTNDKGFQIFAKPGQR